jgi:hypothetical protein
MQLKSVGDRWVISTAVQELKRFRSPVMKSVRSIYHAPLANLL